MQLWTIPAASSGNVNESGAINESFSDIWGEFVDLGNAAGTDTPAVRWEIGEDLPLIGTIRDMADPIVFFNPDRYYSPRGTLRRARVLGWYHMVLVARPKRANH